MDNNHHSSLLNWAHYFHGKSMEELKHSLMYTILELEQTKVAVQEELRKRDDQLLCLQDLLKKIIMERDEAQEKCHKLLLEKLLFHHQQQQQIAPLSGISSIEDDPRIGIDQNSGLSASDCEESIVSSPAIDHFQLPSMIELTPQKPLPEKGKLLQAVMKAGPLLQTLLLSGPLPQWKHPPPPLGSFEIPIVTIPATQILHKDSIFSTNGSSSNTSTNCGRVSRKRVSYDGSDSATTENKCQRVVLQ